MKANTIVIIFFFTTIIVTIAAMLSDNVVRRVKEKRRQFVISTSTVLRRIELLNKSSSFEKVQMPISFSKRCTTRRQAETTDSYRYMMSCLADNFDFYEDTLIKTQKNADLFLNYEEQFYNIIDQNSDEQDFYRQYSYYSKIELEECERIKRKPVINITVNIEILYISPAGKSTYRKNDSFDEKQVLNCITEIKQNEVRKVLVQEERKLMSESLRYDILKRDGFKCVLCGATVEDGVKLHVDHINPVSKGGKTIKSNLRTLCDRCNLGKRDKYDLNGIN